ncbi:MAG: GNAT family N-acetyltransferase [Erythrobacter sp.]
MNDIVASIMEVMEAAFDPTWGEAWNARQVSDALVMPSTFAILISENGQIVEAVQEKPAGFCISRHAPGEEELLLIGVKPEFRESGLGRKLILELVENARARDVTRLFLEMRANNPAEHLYRRLGFEPIGKRPKYYRLSNGQRMDAITFGLTV